MIMIIIILYAHTHPRFRSSVGYFPSKSLDLKLRANRTAKRFGCLPTGRVRKKEKNMRFPQYKNQKKDDCSRFLYGFTSPRWVERLNRPISSGLDVGFVEIRPETAEKNKERFIGQIFFGTVQLYRNPKFIIRPVKQEGFVPAGRMGGVVRPRHGASAIARTITGGKLLRCKYRPRLKKRRRDAPGVLRQMARFSAWPYFCQGSSVGGRRRPNAIGMEHYPLQSVSFRSTQSPN